jgi:hypothetical protein
MAEKRADFGRRQREWIGGPESPPGIGLVDLLLRETRAVDSRQDFARDRQIGAQRLDGRRARSRALQMENEGFGTAHDWLTMQRPARLSQLENDVLQFRQHCFKARAGPVVGETCLRVITTVCKTKNKWGGDGLLGVWSV